MIGIGGSKPVFQAVNYKASNGNICRFSQHIILCSLFCHRICSCFQHSCQWKIQNVNNVPIILCILLAVCLDKCSSVQKVKVLALSSMLLLTCSLPKEELCLSPSFPLKGIWVIYLISHDCLFPVRFIQVNKNTFCECAVLCCLVTDLVPVLLPPLQNEMPKWYGWDQYPSLSASLKE